MEICSSGMIRPLKSWNSGTTSDLVIWNFGMVKLSNLEIWNLFNGKEASHYSRYKRQFPTS